MDNSLRKFRDRLRIIIILYTFCERLELNADGNYGIFRREIKIQALDFLLRYPDFLCMELLDLLDSDPALDAQEIKSIITGIYQQKEPDIRVEEMEKFFHGAYVDKTYQNDPIWPTQKGPLCQLKVTTFAKAK